MREPLTVVIADDEAIAREGLEMLVRADAELELVASCANGAEATIAIQRLQPHLILLDVAMPLGNGLDVVRTLSADGALERLPVVVFVTAYDQHAISAFELHAVDYVLKPFDDDRFALALARAKRRVRDAAAGKLNDHLLGVVRALADRTLAESPQQQASGGAPPLTRILVRQDGRSLLLKTDEIDWIEAADYCVRLHAGGRTYTLRESMASFESQLDPQRFFRSHRSAIVNLDRVREIQPTFKGEHVILVRDGSRVTLARSRRAALERLLGNRL